MSDTPLKSALLPVFLQDLTALMARRDGRKGSDGNGAVITGARLVGLEQTARLLEAVTSREDPPSEAIEWLRHLATLSVEALESRYRALEEEAAALTADLATSSPPPAGEAASPERSHEAPPAAEKTAIDTGLYSLFLQELSVHCTTLSEGLLSLEQEQDRGTLLDETMRAAHSIKGAARLVGLAGISSLAHALEDCLVAAGEGRLSLHKEVVDQLLATCDLLAGPLEIPAEQSLSWLEEEGAALEEQHQRLRRLLEGEAAAPAPPSSRAGEERPVAKLSPSGNEGRRALRIEAARLDRILGISNELRRTSRWLGQHTHMLQLVKRQQHELGRLLSQFAQVTAGGSELTHLPRDALRRLEHSRSLLAEELARLEEFDRHITALGTDLESEVLASRMRPFQEGVGGFRRMVRDVAHELGKEAVLRIEGLDTAVDREILDQINAPLNHLLRNAVDHGIEAPDQRQRLGKPVQGTITLSARHNAGMLLVTVSDDGGGIDLETLRGKIVERGLVNQEMAQRLSESEILDFLFLPGFSTRKQVGSISGRGVGLDVVREAVQKLHGRIHASSRPGQGLTVELQLPLSLSVIRCAITRIAGDLYAFPLMRVEGVLRLPREAIAVSGHHHLFRYRNQQVTLIDTASMLELEESRETESDTLAVVVIGGHRGWYGLVVDRLVAEEPIAVQPLDSRLGTLRDVSALSISADGEAIVVLDMDDLLVSAARVADRQELLTDIPAAATGPHPRRILVVDDSMTVREVERQLLTSHGYQVEVAVDGVEGWHLLDSESFDLVITDIDMPRMNGIELVERIKSDARLKATPVMIVSYKEREEDRLLGLRAGADYYLTKGSFHDDTLIRAVEDLIGRAVP